MGSERKPDPLVRARLRVGACQGICAIEDRVRVVRSGNRWLLSFVPFVSSR